jgi:hypothetical protein
MRSDGAPAVQKATNAQFGIAEGDGTTVGAVAGVMSQVAADTVHTTSATVANIAGEDDFNGASLTATLATLSAGQTAFITDQASTALTIALNSQTVNGVPLNTTLHSYGFCNYIYTTTATLNAACFPGFGTITTNALGKFTDGSGAETASTIVDNGSLVTSGEAIVSTQVTLTDGATVAVNANLSNNFLWQPGASGHTLGSPTNTTVGQWLDFLIQQPASGGPYSVTYNAAYSWATGSAPGLNGGASAYTEISCKVTATTPTLLCYGPVTSATSQTNVSAPTAPASTSAYKMQGLAATITPTVSGTILITISGTITAPAGTTVDNGIQYQISYGTGTPPTNAAALTGTQVGGIQSYTSAVAPTAAADVHVPFSHSAVVTGLTVGTAYWLDEAAESITTASDMALSNVSVSAVEIH